MRPDVIVNAAAHAAVDKAESEPELARLINATTPGVIAKTANQLGALRVGITSSKPCYDLLPSETLSR
jgi:dTDP-4-dehydrorhamnose reductase